jgi:hypothetical protein
LLIDHEVRTVKMNCVLCLSTALLLQNAEAQVGTPTTVQADNSSHSAPAPPALTEQRIPLPNTLMDGTPVRLRLSRTISSANEQVGSEVNFEVLDEVKVNSIVVIPKGNLALGTVTDAEHKRTMGRAGRLQVNIDSVRLADGEKAALKATEGGKAGGHVGAMTGAMVATSIVLWPAAPLFLFMHGKDMTIPEGTEVTAYINGDVTVNPVRFTPTQSNSAPAASAQAQLSVDANVPNCDIEVDGAFAGNTPSQLSLPSGNHRISVSKKGYQSWSKSVLVSGSGVHIQAELDPMESAPTPVRASTSH